jgi:hypothetical protein
MTANMFEMHRQKALPSLGIDGMQGLDTQRLETEAHKSVLGRHFRLCIARWKGLEDQPFQSYAIQHIPCTPTVVQDFIRVRHAHIEGLGRNVVLLFERINIPSQTTTTYSLLEAGEQTSNAQKGWTQEIKSSGNRFEMKDTKLIYHPSMIQPMFQRRQSCMVSCDYIRIQKDTHSTPTAQNRIGMLPTKRSCIISYISLFN